MAGSWYYEGPPQWPMYPPPQPPFINGGIRIDPVDQWKQSLSPSVHQHTSKTTLIPEVSASLKATVTSLNRLRDLHLKLSSTDVTESKGLWAEVTELKNTIDKYTSGMNEQKLRQKITRNKRRRKLRKLAREKNKQRRCEVENKCSEWLAKKQNEMTRKRLEKTVEKEASGSMAEVRKKIQDMNNTKSLMEALKELREHRISKKWKMQGLDVNNNESFNQVCSEIADEVSDRLKIYNDENHALHVMMNEQVDAKLTEATSKQKTKSNNPLKLFDYYHQAEQSEESFINIRRQWDMYLSLHGSTVPNEWVEPTTPTSNGWAIYLTVDK